jgi:hypothetical protein
MFRSTLVVATAIALSLTAVSGASAAVVVVKKTVITNGFGAGFGGGFGVGFGTGLGTGGCVFVKKQIVTDFGTSISKSVKVCRSGF